MQSKLFVNSARDDDAAYSNQSDETKEAGNISKSAGQLTRSEQISTLWSDKCCLNISESTDRDFVITSYSSYVWDRK